MLAPADDSASAPPMFDFAYETFNAANAGYPGWEAAVRARLASMRLIVVYAFIDRMQVCANVCAFVCL